MRENTEMKSRDCDKVYQFEQFICSATFLELCIFYAICTA